MSGGKVISVKIPNDVVDLIDDIISGRSYRNRSDFIRDAIMWKLNKHGYKLQLKPPSFETEMSDL
ncbi:MAG: ribbon-helix-helix domain-containing protein [Desulfurococcaceae archaeon TW002]